MQEDLIKSHTHDLSDPGHKHTDSGHGHEDTGHSHGFEDMYNNPEESDNANDRTVGSDSRTTRHAEYVNISRMISLLLKYFPGHHLVRPRSQAAMPN